MRIMKSSLVALVALCVLATTAPLASAATTLKFASLAPQKSTWTKIFKKIKKEVATNTNGELNIELFVGGVQGDEKEVVEKMRTGQLQMAAITAVGLAKIVPDALIFQLPGLFENPAQLDMVRNKVGPDIEKQMEAAGFVLLGWGDVGLYYLYTQSAVKSPSDLSKVKMWVWSDDPIAQSLVKQAGGKGVPMGVPSVTAALANGKVNGYYTGPLAAASLRWYNRSTHMMAHPLSMGIGAIIVSKKAFDALTPEQQTVLREVGSLWSGRLTKKVRKDNRKTLDLMVGANYDGVKVDAAGNVTIGARREGGTKPIVTSWDPAARKDWEQVFRKVQDDLAGRVYSRDLLKRVRSLTGK